MKKRSSLCKLLCAVLAIALMLSGTVAFAASDEASGEASSETALEVPGTPEVIPEGLEIDWTVRYTYAELEEQVEAMAETYPEISTLYSIGTSWQERDLWCLEITNQEIPADEKTGIAVIGPIHGGEREAASCAMYFAWWTLLNSDTEYVQNMLDNYIIYVIPSINPDGYEQSFVINTRQNLRPRDLNGDGVVFSDPYNDIDGDGFIATLYSGTADMEPESPYNLPEGMVEFGTESSDWDGNGILGDDPRNSGIDLNRTFDYQWGRYDIETDVLDDVSLVGSITTTNGTGPATEPEVQAVQQFLQTHEINALTVLHTGEQSVLYPWCYRAYDETEEDDAEIPFMAETAAAMAEAASEGTGRDFYSSSSYDDYPTTAELIDYAYGKFNIHAYTIEVYCGGTGEYSWGDTLPEATWVFYTQEELAEMGVDVENLHNADGVTLAEDEGLWFYTSSRNQMVNTAAEDQDVMVEGIRDAILVMIESEPSGAGYQLPAYMQ